SPDDHARPTKDMTHNQHSAPGPPSMIATGTPTIFAAPIVDDSAVVNVWNGVIVPFPFDFLPTCPIVCWKMYNGLLNWKNFKRNVKKTLATRRAMIIG